MSTTTKSESTTTFDSQLFNMTTIIECGIGGAMKSQGSGFFYNQLAPPDLTIKGGQWRRIDATWLITNRHVALPRINDTETLPDYFIFNLRRVVDDKIEWVPITLSKDDLCKRVRLHSNPIVDVVAIDINDFIKSLSTQDSSVIPYCPLSNDNLPSTSPIPIEITSDLIVASYPRGFYDNLNKFPIVKSGIVASAWNYQFNGELRHTLRPR